jgi:hypothetical protein
MQRAADLGISPGSSSTAEVITVVRVSLRNLGALKARRRIGESRVVMMSPAARCIVLAI